MKILFVASELSPLVKVGGLADVVGSLSGEIGKLGHDIRIILPFYSCVKEKNVPSLKKIFTINIRVEGKNENVVIYSTMYNRIPLYLVENNSYITNGGIYLKASEFSSIARFLFFSRAVAEWLYTKTWEPEIIHVNDWQTGIIPVLIKIKQLQVKTVLTIHNLLIQGQWNYTHVLKFLGLKGFELPSLTQKVSGIYGDDFNIMAQAILNADIITTVSPQYEKEIKTDLSYARGLNTEILKRSDDIYGIINGISVDIFNPETDPYIHKQYSVKHIENKIINKLYLQKKVGFVIDKNVPLLGVVSRLDEQKGMDFLAKTVDKIVTLGCQIIFLGMGEEKYERMLTQCAQKYPNHIATYIQFDPKFAQEIYAGADIFLMPSRFEPCGLSQLIAMRYGTIPIVRATGGLKNTVENVIVKKGLRGRVKGVGFRFDLLDEKKFIFTLTRALQIYLRKKLWRQIQINAMRADFSWRVSAQKYIKLYKKVTHKSVD